MEVAVAEGGQRFEGAAPATAIAVGDRGGLSPTEGH